MRKALFLTLAIVLLVLIALDRIGLLVAENQIASRVQKSQSLESHPDVSIKGFPFLTQVISGNYGEVDVAVSDVTRNGLTVDRVSVHAHGVSVPLSQIVSGSVHEVPVDSADALVTLSFANLNKYIGGRLGRLLSVSSDGNKLKLTGTLPIPPRISLSVDANIQVAGNSLTLTPAAIDSALSSLPGGQVMRGLVEQFFTIRLPISQLPFGIRLRSATVTQNAVLIAASATGLTLRAPSG